MRDLDAFVTEGWNGRLLPSVRSKGGVLAFANFDDQLIRPEGIPWPPAQILQKLFRSGHESAFDDKARAVLTARLGFYCNLQSINSEDAMTWNYFGPLLAAPQPERVKFINWLEKKLNPQAKQNRTCDIDLWRRIPHPDNQGQSGPEVDFTLIGDRSVVLGEAKWRGTDGKGQGQYGNKTQLQLRSEFLQKYGKVIYGGRDLYVLYITLDQQQAAAPQLPLVSHLTWDDLLQYQDHPMFDEVDRYFKWKRAHM